MAKRDYDYLFKLVLIGDSGVGKSCLLLRFAVRATSCGGGGVGRNGRVPPRVALRGALPARARRRSRRLADPWACGRLF